MNHLGKDTGGKEEVNNMESQILTEIGKKKRKKKDRRTIRLHHVDSIPHKG